MPLGASILCVSRDGCEFRKPVVTERRNGEITCLADSCTLLHFFTAQTPEDLRPRLKRKSCFSQMNISVTY